MNLQNNSPGPLFIKNYELLGELSRGSFGVVYKAHVANTNNDEMNDESINQLHAVKIASSRAEATAESRTRWFKELACLKALANHPHILHLEDAIELRNDPHALMAAQISVPGTQGVLPAIVTEFCEGGDLLHRLMEHGKLNENGARRAFKQLLDAIEYSHSKGIVHRDIKLENVFLDARGNVKLGDWGFATPWSPDSFLHESCGSLHYAAPEICRGEAYRGPEVDVWSLGVCLYSMVAGCLPFRGRDGAKIKECIWTGNYDLYRPEFSDDLRALIAGMLNIDRQKRFSIAQVKNSAWMRCMYNVRPSIDRVLTAKTQAEQTKVIAQQQQQQQQQQQEQQKRNHKKRVFSIMAKVFKLGSASSSEAAISA